MFEMLMMYVYVNTCDVWKLKMLICHFYASNPWYLYASNIKIGVSVKKSMKLHEQPVRDLS